MTWRSYARQTDGPPNVLLIQADDLGYGDLSACGQTHFQTPVLDRLAREGIRFTNYYSGNTVCAPSRATLMTGLHFGHAWIRGNGGMPGGDVPLRPEDVTIAEVLRDAGYRTASPITCGATANASASISIATMSTICSRRKPAPSSNAPIAVHSSST